MKEEEWEKEFGEWHSRLRCETCHRICTHIEWEREAYLAACRKRQERIEQLEFNLRFNANMSEAHIKELEAEVTTYRNACGELEKKGKKLRGAIEE